MGCAAPSPSVISYVRSVPDVAPEFVLPISTRSATLLNLLLQEPAVDLELAASVVAVDPALAFDVLQLANREPGGDGPPLWELAPALVAAGREPLLRLLECTGRAGSADGPAGDPRFYSRLRRGAVRACVAQFLGRELGRCNPKKCWLGGLLFEIPKLIVLSGSRRTCHASRVAAAIGNSLPPTLFLTAKFDLMRSTDEPFFATILIAELLLRQEIGGGIDRLDAAGWGCWPDLATQGRSMLLARGSVLERWAAANFDRLQPWDFLARLERSEPWE